MWKAYESDSNHEIALAIRKQIRQFWDVQMHRAYSNEDSELPRCVKKFLTMRVGLGPS